MYTISGDRNLPEPELAHLTGYEEWRPVRIGNGVSTRYQADVTGG